MFKSRLQIAGEALAIAAFSASAAAQNPQAPINTLTDLEAAVLAGRFSTSPAACSEGTPSFTTSRPMTVKVRTRDELDLAGVRFLKADVEGGEREVLDGARTTIARDRPIILLELLSGTHENPAALPTAICESFGYEAFLIQRGEKIAALPKPLAATAYRQGCQPRFFGRNPLIARRLDFRRFTAKSLNFGRFNWGCDTMQHLLKRRHGFPIC